jgi:hypothetical protein
MSGNHYYIVVGVTNIGGEQRVELFNPRTASQPKLTLSRDQFNAVVTDTDTPDREGDYMRSGVNQDAQRRLGMDPDAHTKRAPSLLN